MHLWRGTHDRTALFRLGSGHAAAQTRLRRRAPGRGPLVSGSHGGYISPSPRRLVCWCAMTTTRPPAPARRHARCAHARRALFGHRPPCVPAYPNRRTPRPKTARNRPPRPGPRRLRPRPTTAAMRPWRRPARSACWSGTARRGGETGAPRRTETAGCTRCPRSARGRPCCDRRRRSPPAMTAAPTASTRDASERRPSTQQQRRRTPGRRSLRAAAPQRAARMPRACGRLFPPARVWTLSARPVAVVARSAAKASCVLCVVVVGGGGGASTLQHSVPVY